MASYTIASEEGAEFASSKGAAGAEVGDTVDLKLEEREERAVIAAGWLDEPNTKKPKEAKN